MIDIVQQINAVHRQVGDRVLEAGEARSCTIGQTYVATIEDVWDACTDPERIPRWFLPVTGDLRENGHFQFEGNAGGTISRCDPPNAFDATWEYGGSVSWIEVRLTAEDDERTRVELEHIMHVDDHWLQYGPGATGVGWDLGIMGLALHLEGAAAVDPQAEMEWVASDEGRRFMALSSSRWCDANIAAGADEAQARAMAERTTAFYTATDDAPAP